MKKIHPLDLMDFIPNRMVFSKLTCPWWVKLFGFQGPYRQTLIINDDEYEQDVNAPRLGTV